MKNQYLAIGQAVNYVDHDKKVHKATITQVFNQDPGAAHLEYDGKKGKNTAIAEHSDRKEPNTFHFAPASPEEEKTTEAKKS